MYAVKSRAVRKRVVLVLAQNLLSPSVRVLKAVREREGGHGGYSGGAAAAAVFNEKKGGGILD